MPNIKLVTYLHVMALDQKYETCIFQHLVNLFIVVIVPGEVLADQIQKLFNFILAQERTLLLTLLTKRADQAL